MLARQNFWKLGSSNKLEIHRKMCVIAVRASPWIHLHKLCRNYTKRRICLMVLNSAFARGRYFPLSWAGNGTWLLLLLLLFYLCHASHLLPHRVTHTETACHCRLSACAAACWFNHSPVSSRQAGNVNSIAFMYPIWLHRIRHFRHWEASNNCDVPLLQGVDDRRYGTMVWYYRVVVLVVVVGWMDGWMVGWIHFQHTL